MKCFFSNFRRTSFLCSVQLVCRLSPYPSQTRQATDSFSFYFLTFKGIANFTFLLVFSAFVLIISRICGPFESIKLSGFDAFEWFTNSFCPTEKHFASYFMGFPSWFAIPLNSALFSIFKNCLYVYKNLEQDPVDSSQFYFSGLGYPV